MINPSTTRRVAIIGSNRIPFVRSNGAYAKAGNQQMLTAALNGLIERYNLQNKTLGEVAAGAVLKLPKDFNMTRECVLQTSLDPRTPACDIQQACDTGIETAVYIANKIALGQIDVGIAAGVDTTSQAPISINEKLRQVLLNANTKKSTQDKVKAVLKANPSWLFKINPPQNAEQTTGLSMGEHTAFTAEYYEVERALQDELTYNSHKNLHRSYQEGFHDDLVTPFMGVEIDNNLRPGSTFEKLSTLKPVFGNKETGTMTAGNSTPLTDGAASILLASEQWAKANGYEPLAYLTFAQLAAIEFVENKHQLLMAPVLAMNTMLKKANLKLQDFDFYEIHEAFAAQTMATLKVWESQELSQKNFGIDALGAIDKSKLNVNGSSLAAGHPFAATGGRILGVLAKLLHQKGSGRGVISICAAGGQGMTAILEK